MTVMMKKVNIRKKYHEFNVTDEKNKIWKGSTEKWHIFIVVNLVIPMRNVLN